MKKIIIAFILAASLTTVCACGQIDASGFIDKSSDIIYDSTQAESVEILEAVIPVIEMTENDSVLTVGETADPELISALGITSDSAEYIYLQGSTVQSSGGSVVFADGKLTISSSGTFILSGSLSNAQLYIDADKNDNVSIVLYGVSVTCSYAPALYVNKAGSCTVYTVKNTVNTLSDGEVYKDEADADPDACIYCKSDLVIAGEGILYINGNHLDALKGKDNLTINGGILFVTAKDDGITGSDTLTINGGSITVVCEGDALKSSNDEDENCGNITVNDGEIIIKANGDGMDSCNMLVINGGTVSGTTGTGSYESKNNGNFDRFGSWGADTTTLEETVSQKGIKSGKSIVITGGNISLSCYDDAIHSNGSLNISDGVINIASGDDGIHADDEMIITGGQINVTQSYEGLEAALITVDGGKISLISSDDGFNVTDGTGDEDMGMHGGWGQNDNVITNESTQILTINGGTIHINAGGDGLDSNGSIIQNGGYVIVDGPSDSANGAIDYGSGYTITGGTLIAAGEVGMAQAPSNAENQAVISVNVNGAAGSEFILIDVNGNELINFTSAKAYGNIVISSPEIQVGNTFTYTLDGVSSEIEVTSAITGSINGMSGGFGGGNIKGGFGGQSKNGMMNGERPAQP